MNVRNSALIKRHFSTSQLGRFSNHHPGDISLVLVSCTYSYFAGCFLKPLGLKKSRFVSASGAVCLPKNSKMTYSLAAPSRRRESTGTSTRQDGSELLNQ
ncbi:hypothetical protein J6590_001610 [Homalodisca vitripennis]|nr:hypothetical protein J6590_001610 [Homalodisca vitripennis]